MWSDIAEYWWLWTVLLLAQVLKYVWLFRRDREDRVAEQVAERTEGEGETT